MSPRGPARPHPAVDAVREAYEADAAARAAALRTRFALRRAVREAMEAGAPVTQVMDGAHIARQTAYDWAQPD